MSRLAFKQSIEFQSTPLSIERSDANPECMSAQTAEFQSTPLSIERSDARSNYCPLAAATGFNPRPSP